MLSFCYTFSLLGSFGLKVTENPMETDLNIKENILTSIVEKSGIRTGFRLFWALDSKIQLISSENIDWSGLGHLTLPEDCVYVNIRVCV